MNHRLSRTLACFVCLLLAPVAARGADVLDQLPTDTLGFVLVHNLNHVDTKVGQLAALVQHNVPRPLAFLKEFAGLSEGINPDGDALVALFPTSEGSEQGIEFCVWIPVSDYDHFLKSLSATSIDGVAAATIAGEDLLVAHRGNWALIMDPDQRERLSLIASADPVSPELPAWKGWLASNDITVVAFTPGIRALAGAIGDEEASGDPLSQSSPNDQNPNQRNLNNNRRTVVQYRTGPSFADMLGEAKAAYRKWSAAAPELAEAVQQATVVGCGLRFDPSGNALTSLRVAIPKELTDPLTAKKANNATDLPVALYESGGFVLHGGGRLPTPLVTAYAKAYARRVATDLKDEEHTDLDETATKRLLDAVDVAAADVRSVLLLSQPGQDLQPVYSNDFLAVRVASATAFADHAREVMRLWNSANRDAKGDTKLVFDMEEIKLGERSATQYSLDIAALEGGLVLPEVRQAMEKMFGPGGKLRLWIVPVDDTTVLLATATSAQLTDILKVFDKQQKVDWSRGEQGQSNALLPADADWRIFVDVNRYFEWKRRESSAIVGERVIGGPLVRDFPASPPLGISGGFREGEVWLEMATLAPTIKSADMYMTRNRLRAAIQLRARGFAPAPQPPAAPPKK